MILNIFDFDGTLFNSPVPRYDLWEPGFYGRLQNSYKSNGYGWFIKPITLDCADVNQFNDEIVDKVKESNKNKSSITVLLTGRNIDNSKKIKELFRMKGLHFDHMYFKKDYSISTFEFKMSVISLLIDTYLVNEVNIYEDRADQIKKFRECVLNKIASINVVECDYPEYHLSEYKEKSLVRELLMDERIGKKINKIDISDEIEPTIQFAIVFDERVSQYLNNEFYDIIPFDFLPKKEHHMTVGIGNPSISSMSFVEKNLGKQVKVKAVALGIDKNATCLYVDTVIPSQSTKKHITLAHAYDASPYASNLIDVEYELSDPIELIGTLERVAYRPS